MSKRTVINMSSTGLVLSAASAAMILSMVSCEIGKSIKSEHLEDMSLTPIQRFNKKTSDRCLSSSQMARTTSCAEFFKAYMEDQNESY